MEKNIYKKVIGQFWTRQYVNDIKTKKTLKFLNIKALRTVWNSIESETEVKKAVINVRVLTGVYILQAERHLLRGGAVETTSQFCWLEDEASLNSQHSA